MVGKLSLDLVVRFYALQSRQVVALTPGMPQHRNWFRASDSRTLTKPLSSLVPLPGLRTKVSEVFVLRLDFRNTDWF